MRHRSTLTTLLVCGCLTTAPAFAQQGKGDISVDPNSPAGVEYELPLNAAREDAAGSQTAPAGTGSGERRAAPLFGAGVQADDAAASGSGASGEQADDAPPEFTVRTGIGADATRAAAGDGLHSGATIALGALLVLVTGGVIGLVLRRPSHR